MGTAKRRPRRRGQSAAEIAKLQARDLIRIRVSLPRDLVQRLKLVRAVTGIPTAEWCRWQLAMAADLELARRPGALWMRPGSTIYRLHLDPSGEPVTVPVATSLGGERVWCIEVLPDLFVHLGTSVEAKRMDPWLAQSGIVCDLTADQADQVQMRHVVVASRDVLPREPVPWTTGLASLSSSVQRLERQRTMRQRAQAATRTWAMKAGEVGPALEGGTSAPAEDAGA